MTKQFEGLIHGEENLLDWLDKATPRMVEDLKDHVKDHYKNDILARRALLTQIENYYYGREASE